MPALSFGVLVESHFFVSILHRLLSCCLGARNGACLWWRREKTDKRKIRGGGKGRDDV